MLLLGTFGALLTVATLSNRADGANAIVELNVWNHPTPETGSHYQQNYIVPENSTLLAVLKIAARKSADFNFETNCFKGMGNYIVSINGVAEIPSEKKYWMVYKLSTSANTKSPPSKEFQTPKGIDYTRVKNRDIYLLWLQQFQ